MSNVLLNNIAETYNENVAPYVRVLVFTLFQNYIRKPAEFSLKNHISNQLDIGIIIYSDDTHFIALMTKWDRKITSTHLPHAAGQ